VLKLLPRTELLVEQYGKSAPRIIALHGWGRTKDDWNQVLDGLPAVALDLPGFGSAAVPPEAWGTQDYARYLSPVLTALESPILLGHSFGGRVAARLAAMNPSQLTGLVLTGVPLLKLSNSPAKPPFGYTAVKWLHGHRLITEDRLERARQKYGSLDYRTASGILRAIMVRTVNENYEEPLSLIAEAGIPVRLVWGALDSEVPIPVAEAMRARLPSSTLAVVRNSGHSIDADIAAAIRLNLNQLLQST
jgi:pimeloyl-ACP methyl ester carboxylesterase